MSLSIVRKFEPYKHNVEGCGCGSVGRAVASNTKDLQFESSHWPILCTINCIESIFKRRE